MTSGTVTGHIIRFLSTGVGFDQDSAPSVSVRTVYVVGGEKPLHKKPSRCGEASSNPRALSWDLNQAIGVLANGFNR